MSEMAAKNVNDAAINEIMREVECTAVKWEKIVRNTDSPKCSDVINLISRLYTTIEKDKPRYFVFCASPKEMSEVSRNKSRNGYLVDTEKKYDKNAVIRDVVKNAVIGEDIWGVEDIGLTASKNKEDIRQKMTILQAAKIFRRIFPSDETSSPINDVLRRCVIAGNDDGFRGIKRRFHEVMAPIINSIKRCVGDNVIYSGTDTTETALLDILKAHYTGDFPENINLYVELDKIGGWWIAGDNIVFVSDRHSEIEFNINDTYRNIMIGYSNGEKHVSADNFIR